MKPPLVIVKPKGTKPDTAPKRASAAPAQPHAAERFDFTPRQRPNPLGVAQIWLGSRLTEKTMPDGSTSHFLDGRPTYLDAIMRETNRVLQANGHEQIGRSERWLV